MNLNINDVPLRVLKKNDQISEQILHRNEEDALEIRAREARDREIADKFQEEEWEISKLERLKQVEIDCQTENERWHSDELKKIEKKARDRKLELERLREAASELEEANRLKKAEDEEIAELKRRIAAEEENRQSNRIGGWLSEKKSSRQEDEVDEEEDEESEGNIVIEEASEEEEERPVERSSKAKRNASGSPRRRLVESWDSTDDEENLQSLRNPRPTRRMARRNLSSASLPEEDLQSMRSATRMSRWNRLPSASLRVQEWSGSNSRSGSPMYMLGTASGIHPNRYFPTYLGSFSPPTGFYMPGTVINGNVTNTTVTIPTYARKTWISSFCWFVISFLFF